VRHPLVQKSSPKSENGLRALREMALRMGGLAEAILDRALRAVWERDSELAAAVHEDDLAIDRLEIEIDEAILRFLAQHSPLARDLRQVLAIKAMANDLERVGDLARNIARAAERLAGRPEAGMSPALRGLADAARRLLHDAITAFADLDPARARAVVRDDDPVDEQEGRVVREAIDTIQQDPARCEQQIDLIHIARALERVADHATNIAEDVVLVDEALNLNHASKLAG